MIDRTACERNTSQMEVPAVAKVDLSEVGIFRRRPTTFVKVN
jgi:hypothetical protein